MSKKTKRERKQRLFRRKVMIIAGVILLVLSLAVWGLFAFLSSRQEKGTDPGPQGTPDVALDQARAKRNGKTRDDAQKEIDGGNTDRANQIYDDAIRAEPDVTQKIKLARDQSELLFNAGRYDDAIAVAKKAGELSNDKYIIADWLARVYEQRGDMSDAAAYYTLAGQWATSPTNVSGFDQTYYDGEAARVKKAAQ